MLKELADKIEESRYRLYIIAPSKKEKLLTESRKLDLLILEYYKLKGLSAEETKGSGFS